MMVLVSFPEWIEALFTVLACLTVFGGIVLALDDLWIDLYAMAKGLRPKHLNEEDLSRLNTNPQKRIAIIVANWREADVLEQMVRGNLANVDYSSYTFFLGVYPNDTATKEIALRLEQNCEQVRAVVNSRNGPTTKGQMLNEIVREVFSWESREGVQFDAVMMQDSEDVLHPLSLKLVNDSLQSCDFVQIPVFSFNVERNELVGGTYLDEFSESHTKDLLVRDSMGAAIPSAGVGTAMSRRLVLANMLRQRGDLLREDTLTEDYDLGLSAKRQGFRGAFVCCYRIKEDGTRDFIATREFFPARMAASIRQKTRWVLGIVFQGWRNIGWAGSAVDRYFLFRDRRGPFNAALILSGALLLLACALAWLFDLPLPQIFGEPAFQVPATFNAGNMIWRIVQRMRAVRLVNGESHSWMVPLRWPVGNIINTLAAFSALQSHWRTIRTGVAAKWEKTDHVLPAGFGGLTAGAGLMTSTSNFKAVAGSQEVANFESAEVI
jgi:adsorption protein B